MTFNHLTKPPLLPLDRKVVDGKRYYITPVGDLPSVTTVLGSFEDSGLTGWKDAVGPLEVDRVLGIASRRGTLLHNLSEDYLNNKPIDFDSMMPDMKVAFKKFTKALDHIDNIWYIEVPLYSQKLGLAGQTDCIAEYDGVLSIIDFKTSKRPKNDEDIQKYFEQETAYDLMFYHMTGIAINQIVTIMHEDYASEPKIFVKKPADYILSLKAKIKKYKEMNQ